MPADSEAATVAATAHQHHEHDNQAQHGHTQANHKVSSGCIQCHVYMEGGGESEYHLSSHPLSLYMYLPPKAGSCTMLIGRGRGYGRSLGMRGKGWE